MTLRHRRETGDVPPSVAAHHMGCASVEAFKKVLPALINRGFPTPTTNGFDLDAIDRWRRARHPHLFPPGPPAPEPTAFERDLWRRAEAALDDLQIVTFENYLAPIAAGFASESRGLSFVYFIGAGVHVKIGLAADPQRRLKNLQTGNPAELQILALIPGDVVVERCLHALFAEFAIGREWFRLEGDLAQFVGLCAGRR